MNRIYDILLRWVSIFMLGILIIGGCAIIMHDPYYELDDDTIIQSKLGIGEPQPISERPVFVPEEGRFFPLGYQHFNALLLLFPDGVSAAAVFGLQALLWCLLMIVVYYIGILCLNNITDNWKWMISAIVAAIVATRVLQYFTVVWTVISFGFVLLSLFILALYYYCRDGKYCQLVLLIIIAAYYSFCLETNIVLPFILGLVALINLSSNHERDFPLIVSSFSIVLLFGLLYAVFILPYVNNSYDPSHGAGVSMLENIKTILLGQKLLILSIIIFCYRLYTIFVKKDDFDDFSDTLLAIAIASLCANIVIGLNFPVYYIGVVILSIPSYLRMLNFKNRKYCVISITILLLATGYFVPKGCRLAKDLWNGRTAIKEKMVKFDELCQSYENIFFYSDANLNKFEDSWANSHIQSHLKYLAGKQAIVLSNDSISISKFNSALEWMVCFHSSYEFDEVCVTLDIPDSKRVSMGYAPGIKYISTNQNVYK